MGDESVRRWNIINVIIMSNSYNHSQTINSGELNYHSRKKGKTAKPKKFKSSPLHQQSLSSLVINSRCRSKSSNSQSESINDSIIWLNQVKMDQPTKILILEPQQPTEMLIVESEDQQESDGRGDSDENGVERQVAWVGSPGKSERNVTSILICEENEDLLWINQQHFQQQQNSPYHQCFNTTQSPQYFKENFSAPLHIHNPHPIPHFEQLSNIEELSSRAQQDYEQHFQRQNLSKAPISPQTQPLLKARPQKMHHQILDEKSWITHQEACSSPIDTLTEEQFGSKGERFKLKIDINTLFSQNATKPESYKDRVKRIFAQQKDSLFQSELKQLNQIKNSTCTQYKSNVEEIIDILQQQKKRLKAKLAKQDSELRIFKCSLYAKTRLLSASELALGRNATKQTKLSEDDQIKLNAKVLIRMVQLIKRT